MLESAINQVVRLNLGPPIILPTASDIDDTLVIGETQRFFNRALQDLDDSRLALTNLKTNATAQDDTRAAANEASVLLEAALSAIEGLAFKVDGVDPLGLIPPRLRGPAEIDSPFLSIPPRGGVPFPIENMATCRLQSGVSGSTDGTSAQTSACVIMRCSG